MELSCSPSLTQPRDGSCWEGKVVLRGGGRERLVRSRTLRMRVKSTPAGEARELSHDAWSRFVRCRSLLPSLQSRQREVERKGNCLCSGWCMLAPPWAFPNSPSFFQERLPRRTKVERVLLPSPYFFSFLTLKSIPHKQRRLPSEQQPGFSTGAPRRRGILPLGTLHHFSQLEKTTSKPGPCDCLLFSFLPCILARKREEREKE